MFFSVRGQGGPIQRRVSYLDGFIVVLSSIQPKTTKRVIRRIYCGRRGFLQFVFALEWSRRGFRMYVNGFYHWCWCKEAARSNFYLTFLKLAKSGRALKAIEEWHTNQNLFFSFSKT